jgi:hypothetical protein
VEDVVDLLQDRLRNRKSRQTFSAFETSVWSILAQVAEVLKHLRQKMIYVQCVKYRVSLITKKNIRKFTIFALAWCD